MHSQIMLRFQKQQVFLVYVVAVTLGEQSVQLMKQDLIVLQ